MAVASPAPNTPPVIQNHKDKVKDDICDIAGGGGDHDQFWISVAADDDS